MADEKTISHDFRTHRDAWRKAITDKIEEQLKIDPLGTESDLVYWEHELKVFDKAFDSLLGSGFKEV